MPLKVVHGSLGYSVYIVHEMIFFLHRRLFLLLDEAIASLAVIAIISRADGRTEMLLEPTK